MRSGGGPSARTVSAGQAPAGAGRGCLQADSPRASGRLSPRMPQGSAPAYASGLTLGPDLAPETWPLTPPPRSAHGGSVAFARSGRAGPSPAPRPRLQAGGPRCGPGSWRGRKWRRLAEVGAAGAGDVARDTLREMKVEEEVRGTCRCLTDGEVALCKGGRRRGRPGPWVPDGVCTRSPGPGPRPPGPPRSCPRGETAPGPVAGLGLGGPSREARSPGAGAGRPSARQLGSRTVGSVSSTVR